MCRRLTHRLTSSFCLQKKVLCDRNGQVVANITSKLLTMHDTVEIHSADGKQLLAEVKKQLVSFTHGAKVNVTGMQFPLEVKGDFRGKNFQVIFSVQLLCIAASLTGNSWQMQVPHTPACLPGMSSAQGPRGRLSRQHWSLYKLPSADSTAGCCLVTDVSAMEA